MPSLDLDQQIQVELLEQEKIKTSLARREAEQKERDADSRRRDRAEWGAFLRGAFGVLGVAGLLGLGGYGISVWMDTHKDPCVESYVETRDKINSQRNTQVTCDHPDHRAKVEESEIQTMKGGETEGYRIVRVTCACPHPQVEKSP